MLSHSNIREIDLYRDYILVGGNWTTKLRPINEAPEGNRDFRLL